MLGSTDAWVSRCRSNARAAGLFSPLAALGRSTQGKTHATQHCITQNTVAAAVLSLQDTCQEIPIRRYFRPRGKSKRPIRLISPLSFPPWRGSKGEEPSKADLQSQLALPWTDPALGLWAVFLTGWCCGCVMMNSNCRQCYVKQGSTYKQMPSWQEPVHFWVAVRPRGTFEKQSETKAWSARPTHWYETLSSQKVPQTYMKHGGKDRTPGHFSAYAKENPFSEPSPKPPLLKGVLQGVTGISIPAAVLRQKALSVWEVESLEGAGDCWPPPTSYITQGGNSWLHLCLLFSQHMVNIHSPTVAATFGLFCIINEFIPEIHTIASLTFLSEASEIGQGQILDFFGAAWKFFLVLLHKVITLPSHMANSHTWSLENSMFAVFYPKIIATSCNIFIYTYRCLCT